MGITAKNLKRSLRVYKSPEAVPPLPFTEPAEAAVEHNTEAYRGQLITRSQFLASSASLDDVSKDHVERAVRDLRGPGAHSKKHIGVIGGLVAGASLSSLLDLFSDTHDFNFLFGFGLVGLLVIGLLLISEAKGRKP